jgi:PAS domain S-box-containing protein
MNCIIPFVAQSSAESRLVALSGELLGTASLDGYLTLLNPAWQRVLGWSNESLMAQPFIDLAHVDDFEDTRSAVTRLAMSGAGSAVDFENRYRAKDGQFRNLEWHIVADDRSWYIVAREITEYRTIQYELERTEGIYRSIIDNVGDGLYIADSNGKITSINPSGFQMLGYESDEELFNRDHHAAFHYSRPDGALFPISECALEKVRATGSPIHAGEDVFWRKDGSALPVSYSSAPVDIGHGIGSLVTFRDASALVAERERERSLTDEAEWFDKINEVLAEDRFVLYGQPVVDIASGMVLQHELLLRILLPNGGVIGPDRFLPVAEKFGLIHQIDRWVITQGIEIAATGMRVAINLSVESMIRLNVLLHIERELARTGVAAKDLTFELTESAVVKNVEEGRRFADRLVALGCTFALDDFGTGYASLRYLRELPITYVKIDGQFVNGITQNQSDSDMVEAIVQMAHTLGKTTIAEGIEDEQTLNKLRNFGVDLGQGFFIGRPGPLFETGHAILTR